MDVFEITTDKADGVSKIVSCPERQLYMKVIPEPEEDPGDELVISANFHGPFEDGEEVFFQALYRNLDRDFKKWDMELFFNAAEYYCQVELDKEPMGFSKVTDYPFYPYEKGANDLTEENTSPELWEALGGNKLKKDDEED